MLESLGRLLLRVAGCLLILAAVLAAWFGSGEQRSMQGQEANILAAAGQRGIRVSVERADKEIAEAHAAIGGIRLRMYFWYGAVAAFLVLGVVLVVLPSRWLGRAPLAESPPP